MKVDAFATQPHYVHHLAPIWHALPADTRGTFYTAGDATGAATTEGIGTTRGIPRGRSPVTLVAGYADEAAVRRPVIYLEHGAGQTYRDARGGEAYSGGGGHDRTRLFLAPNGTVADRWRARYPATPAVAVGCPKLDWLHTHPRATPRAAGPTVVCFTWHHNSFSVPETISAWRHYEPHMHTVISDLADAGVTVIGHSHPRRWTEMRDTWARLGVEPVRNLDSALRRADVMVGDNTSALPEAASVGIPLVFLNAPWYRRDVHHGGRFWEWPAGQVSVDRAEDVADGVLEALADRPETRAAREAMVAAVYVAVDGHAAERAARAITDLLRLDA